MGSALGRLLVDGGEEVGWVSAGRSAATRRRATDAGLTDLGGLDRLRRECAVVLSVCPPHGAVDLAGELSGYTGVYADLNAVSPDTTHRVGEIITAGGGRYVDGGVVGPPPTRPGSTRLYLSGPAAEQVAGLFVGTDLTTRVLGPEVGTASALKMMYAAWTKGTTAMLVAIRAAARSLAVEDALLAEWADSQPGLVEKSEHSARLGLERGWRWAFELAEIGRTFAAADLPDGFGSAAAEIFHRLATDPTHLVSGKRR